eukprot:CAMPEP_0182800966 /NCGR_PEP_ID=MMETSP0006_2-20121128/2692_1 /TAXON_ID=97485 /ORGANISM="Prymnesium parvum, Strain Texoma1" /LENGTH=172 /DNA_ID=CAMNT_0024926239 /DNA_START=126 /DNA_END=641 /DNA_ORIENTATION=-
MIRPRWSHPPAPGRGEMAPSSARAEVQAADSLDTSGLAQPLGQAVGVEGMRAAPEHGRRVARLDALAADRALGVEANPHRDRQPALHLEGNRRAEEGVGKLARAHQLGAERVELAYGGQQQRHRHEHRHVHEGEGVRQQRLIGGRRGEREAQLDEGEGRAERHEEEEEWQRG